MKQALSILLAYITCTDPAVKTKWANVLASYWHKDEGSIVTNITNAENGDVTLTLIDASGATAETTIEKTQLPTSHDISFINGLEDILNNKVTKVTGKGLSTNDFTGLLKAKLEGISTIPSDISDLTDTLGILAQSIGVAQLKEELKATVALGDAANVDWSLGVQFEKTLTEDTTLTFSNVLEGKTITLVTDGPFNLILPAGFSPEALDDYDNTKTNYIQIYCANATAGSEVFLSSLEAR